MWRKEIAKVACFVVCLIVINAILREAYVHVVMKGTVAERSANGFEQLRADVDTLVLGDSHSKWGVHPTKLGRAFNLALAGQPYAETYYTLKLYAERDDVNLRFVIIPADPHSFSSRQLDEWALLYHYATFVDYVELGRRRGKPLEYAVRQWQGSFAPYVSERRFILSFLKHRSPPVDIWLKDSRLERGAILADESFGDFSQKKRQRMGRESAASHLKGHDPFTPIAVEYFERILKLCAANGIDLIVVKFPLAGEYLEAAAELLDLAEFDRRLEALVSPYPNVHVLDRRRLFIDRPGYFLNADHLNSQGAIVVSRSIRRMIRGLRSGEAVMKP